MVTLILGPKLRHYWSMSNMCDAVGGARLFNGFNYGFTEDRFGKPNSAISFSDGYISVTSGVYFSGDFTITAWIKLRSYRSFSQLIDFANGVDNGNFMFGMGKIGPDMRLVVCGGDCQELLTNEYSKTLLPLNEWFHVAAVLRDKKSFILINSTLAATGELRQPNNTLRTSNFIGRSNRKADLPSDAIFDEIKIYKSPLTPEEVRLDMSIGSDNSK